MVAKSELVAALKLLSQAPAGELVDLLRMQGLDTGSLCLGVVTYLQQGSSLVNDNNDAATVIIASRAEGVGDRESTQTNDCSVLAVLGNNVEEHHIGNAATQVDSVTIQDQEVDQAQQSLSNDSAAINTLSPQPHIPIRRKISKLQGQIKSTLNKWSREMEVIEAHLKGGVLALEMQPDSKDCRLSDIILSPNDNTIAEKMRSCLASWTYGIELELFERGLNEISTMEQYIDNVANTCIGGLMKYVKTHPQKLQSKIQHATKMGKRYRILDGWAAQWGCYGVSVLLGLVLPPLTSMKISEMREFVQTFLSTPTVSAIFKLYQPTLKSLQVAYIKQCQSLNADNHAYLADVLEHVLVIQVIPISEQSLDGILSRKRIHERDVIDLPKRPRCNGLDYTDFARIFPSCDDLAQQANILADLDDPFQQANIPAELDDSNIFDDLAQQANIPAELDDPNILAELDDPNIFAELDDSNIFDDLAQQANILAGFEDFAQ